MKILKELFMDLVSRTLLKQKRLFQKSGILLDHMLIKFKQSVAMEQRAREMGKTSEAAVYRKYINAMKKKTKKMNEAANPAQQAAIAIDMKKKGKKPKNMKEGMYNQY